MNTTAPNRSGRDKPKGASNPGQADAPDAVVSQSLLLSGFHVSAWKQPILRTLQCAALRSENKFHLKLFYRIHASE